MLLDDCLPDPSGEELWRAIQHQPPKTSVALLQTSQPVEEAQSHFLRIGGRCILNKTTPYKIAQSVHEYVSRNAAGSEASREAADGRAASLKHVCWAAESQSRFRHPEEEI